MDKENQARSRFLDDVTEQISCRLVHASVRKELEDHILDRTEDFEAQGFSHEEAEQRAIRAMGDPVSIGARLNEIHKIRKAPALTALTLLLLSLGLFVSWYMRWSPEQSANGFLYYIPGLILLAAVSWKGYPLLICRLRFFLKLAGIFYLFLGIVSILLKEGWTWDGMIFRLWSPVIGYFAILFLAPVLVLLAFRLRRSGEKALLLVWGLCAAGIGCFNFFSSWLTLPACAFLLLSLGSTTAYMTGKGYFQGKKQTLILISLAGFLFSGCLMNASEGARSRFQEFIQPDAHIRSVWDDTYNSALIRELLSRTPMTGGLELMPEEMMEYGSGTWYFTEESPLDAPLPRYVDYDADTVTLWDILPQHYHNNYLIAVCIFLFGWRGGILLLAAIAGFYLILFHCIRKIRGRLASVLSLCCGLLLLFQGVGYILGNFGYQYAAFPNLPLVSEGRISILCNMMLLGLISSAYRYDWVLSEDAAL